MRDFLLNKVAPFVRKNGVAIFLLLFSLAIVAFIFSLRDQTPTPAVPASPTPVIGGPEPPLTSDPPPVPTWSPSGSDTLPPPPARRARDGGK